MLFPQVLQYKYVLATTDTLLLLILLCIFNVVVIIDLTFLFKYS